MARGKLRKPSPHVRFYTVGQAALVTGLERSVLKAAYDDGRIPSAPVPGDVRKVRRAAREDVEAFIEAFQAELQRAR